MAAAKIKADYEQLQDIAKVFRENEDTIRQVQDGIRNQVDTLQGGDWEGVGAKNFYSEMSSMMMPAFTKLAKAMQEADKTANTIAKTMKQAEDDCSNMLQMKG